VGFAAEAALCTVFGDDDYPPIPTFATTCAIAAARAASEVAAAIAERSVASAVAEIESQKACAKEKLEQSHLVRDIFSNASGSKRLAAEWLSQNVIRIANAVYEDRAFQNIHMLAEALEAAGCDDAEILGHCRRPGPHVPGCWVVDLLLGKNR
jgi:hypothetical protein